MFRVPPTPLLKHHILHEIYHFDPFCHCTPCSDTIHHSFHSISHLFFGDHHRRPVTNSLPFSGPRSRDQLHLVRWRCERDPWGCPLVSPVLLRIRLETRVLLESTPDLSSSVNLVMTDTCWVNSRADSLWHSVLCYTVTSRFDLSAIPCFFTTISELELSFFIHMLAGTWLCK